MCNGKCGGGMCLPAKLGKILLLIGGLNWGLVGIGMLMGSNLNVVNLILGGMPTLEAIVYILVGVGAVMKIIGCKCKKCMAGCTCGTEAKTDDTMM
ncbi:MAG TPA: DUF378 domain-containing protein [Candidatus Paceibacterota bacterium]|jgi:uncharacterized membrane protein YuzA (DUF378 family)|nr:DUF378 domain-containing protein [Candidatus Paceibacterota bacterium]